MKAKHVVGDHENQDELLPRLLSLKMRNLNCGENTDGKMNTVSPECEIWLDQRTATELRESSLSEGYSSARGCIDLYACREREGES